MGQARLRGTKEQRVAQAIARQSTMGVAKYAARTVSEKSSGRRRPLIMVSAMMAAVASAIMPAIARRYLGL